KFTLSSSSFFSHTTTTHVSYTLSLHDALPIWSRREAPTGHPGLCGRFHTYSIPAETDRGGRQPTSWRGPSSLAAVVLRQAKRADSWRHIEKQTFFVDFCLWRFTIGVASSLRCARLIHRCLFLPGLLTLFSVHMTSET